MSRPWTLPAMARIAGLSASRFTVLYRRCFGTSPLQDLIAARLGRARWLLATTRLEVGEVARQTGFHDPFHFSRLFRRRTGVSPRHFALRHSEGCRRD
jgi:transcriptional regulator GlxA family with amidase domain